MVLVLMIVHNDGGWAMLHLFVFCLSNVFRLASPSMTVNKQAINH